MNPGEKANCTAEHAENAEKSLFLKRHLRVRGKFPILAFLFGELVKIHRSGESRRPECLEKTGFLLPQEGRLEVEGDFFIRPARVSYLEFLSPLCVLGDL